MALLIVELSEITCPIKGDFRIVQDEIISRLLDLSFNELDDRYGGCDWCLNSKIYVFPGPFLNFRLNLDVAENNDFSELSINVQNIFKKHWENIIRERKKD